MPVPIVAAGGLAALGAFLKVIVIRFVGVFLIYTAFRIVFSVAAHLFIGSGLFTTFLAQLQGDQPISLADAFGSLPAVATQTFFFMHLDRCVSMVGATFTLILGIKLFGKVMEKMDL